MKREILRTHQKAFQINLDKSKYGTIAEIGAGQEVARWFFRVGGASGTIAKAMSAYDMKFSDAIYGPSDRYVSRHRLETMLDHEYSLLVERLEKAAVTRPTSSPSRIPLLPTVTLAGRMVRAGWVFHFRQNRVNRRPE